MKEFSVDELLFFSLYVVQWTAPDFMLSYQKKMNKTWQR